MTASWLPRAVLAGLLAGILAFLLWDALDNRRDKSGVHAGYADIVAGTSPAVVNVYSSRRAEPRASKESSLFREFFGETHGSPRRISMLGSGVILTPEGLIVTNHHVVAGADAVEVSLADGRRLAAELIGSDPETDLAVLRVAAADLPVIAGSTQARPRVGDIVLALGNPWGVGQAVTMGIVGATGRDRLGLTTFEDFIQHDAAINPGHSGGALVNTQGELVGINTAIFSRSGGSDGIGFAIPTRLVMEVVDQIAEHGSVIRGWLGIDAREAVPAERVRSGVRIAGVFADGPADRAGLRAGDIVTRIDDQAVRDLDDLRAGTTAREPGTTIRIDVERDGEPLSFEATLIRRPTP